MGRSIVVAFCILTACSGSSSPSSSDTSEESGTVQGCTQDADCDSGSVCCSGQCENLDLSSNACGSCALECGSAQYCTGTACAALEFQTLCTNPDVKVIHREEKQIDDAVDNPQLDNDASDQLAASFKSLCGAGAPTATVTAEEDVLASASAGPLTTGRGTTLIVAGGRVYSYIIDYLDDVDQTPVELVTTDTTFQLVARSKRKVIVSDSLASLNDNHDFVVGQAIYDATSGTQVLNVYGIFQHATDMGVGYFSEFITQAGAGNALWFVGKLEDGVVTRLDGE